MNHAVIFPGQGSQRRGMGRDLFDRCKEIVSQADRILGYSIKELCLKDPDKQLNLTRFTQPAVFTVNAMAYEAVREEGAGSPLFFAGHSLGEYNALAAANAIEFSTGLELVKKRGELMAAAQNGGMAAVINMAPGRIQDCLEENGLDKIEVANFNTPSQTVVSGDRAQIEAAKPMFEAVDKTRYLILPVSGAFHASPMAEAALEFRAFMEQFEFRPPEIPVVSNVLARPYPGDDIKELLCRQMTSPVLWMDSVRYMKAEGAEEFREVGPGKVLTKMLKPILDAPGQTRSQDHALPSA